MRLVVVVRLLNSRIGFQKPVLRVRIVERDTVLPQHLDQRAKHERAGRQEHHGLTRREVLLCVLEDGAIDVLVRVAFGQVTRRQHRAADTLSPGAWSPS